MQKWEYKIVELTPGTNKTLWQQELNRLGVEGWELVSIQNYITAYLKRQKK